MWAEKLGAQLGRPTWSVGGWLVSRFFVKRNRVLEESAVRLCGIEPGDTVLEVGHGPGLGLQAAAKLLTHPTGTLIGVDYSEYMHNKADALLKDHITSDLRKATSELHRVMKPGALMVTTLRLSMVSYMASKHVMPKENWRPDAYMAALRDSGFTDVRMEDKHAKNITFQAIYATALK
ncbi:unnamed protein product [Knipowitschia caucasica]